MTPEQLNELHDALLQRHDELQKVIDDTTEVFHSQTSLNDNDNQIDFNHPADMLQADPDYEKELQLISRERHELELVDQALLRQREGSYGICGECEEEISFARLKALPYARYCIACQKEVDARSNRARAS